MSEWSDVPVFGQRSGVDPAVVRPSAYALLFDSRGLLAVVRTAAGVFLPGGGIEAGEEVNETVAREVTEECGVSVRIGQWSARAVDFVFSPSEQSRFEKRSTFVDARVEAAVAAPRTPDHVLEWVDPARASATLSPPSHRWALEQWHRGSAQS
jgi:8-oxo-dGTP diphosphatase